MPDCDYCGSAFSDDESYLDHLEATHADELGPIDRRRVEQRTSANEGVSRGVAGRLDSVSSSIPGGTLAIVVLLGLVVLLVGVVVLNSTVALNGVHEHGVLVLEIDGERVDFDQPQYHEPDYFHFHSGDGETWHMHPDRLTFEEAMDDLGVPVTETSVAVEGTTYEDADPDTTVRMEINGESAELDREIFDGDAIEIVVETGGDDG